VIDVVSEELLGSGSVVESVSSGGLEESEKIDLGGSGSGIDARSREDVGLWDEE
jgi:hypothetical protein